MKEAEVVGTKNEKTLVYQTILSSPGMGEKLKVQLQLSRQTIVLLCHLLENGLAENNERINPSILNAVSEESLRELKAVAEDILGKSGLSDFYQKLKLIQ